MKVASWLLSQLENKVLHKVCIVQDFSEEAISMSVDFFDNSFN